MKVIWLSVKKNEMHANRVGIFFFLLRLGNRTKGVTFFSWSWKKRRRRKKRRRHASKREWVFLCDSIVIKDSHSVLGINIAGARPDSCATDSPSGLKGEFINWQQRRGKERETYCKAVMISGEGWPRAVDVREAPIKTSWSAVLTLLIIVGRTSAEGIEKSK